MAVVTEDLLSERHRLAQARLGARLVGQLRAVWPLLDAENLDGSFGGWLLAAHPLIAAQRVQSARLAAAYLDRSKKLALGDGARLVPVLAEWLEPEQLAVSLLVTGPVSVKKAMTRGVLLDAAMDTAQARSSAAAMRHALDGGRETVIGTLKADPDARGWARATSGKPCKFCSMLAGRGAVYSAATVGFRPHDGCSCSVRAVY